MAQAGIFAPGPVISASVRVLVNGVERPVESMSWAGDTTGGLPDQVVSAGTGIRSRTGSIQWASDPVQVDPPHPLRRTGGWPPREGDEVVINATVDTGSGPYQFRRFTGRIGRTTGSLVDGTLTSEVTDTLGDSLQALCTVPPIISNERHYMRTHWTMYQALAQAGLGAIPGPDKDTILWNGYQGGLRPLVGEFVASGTEYGDSYGLLTWTDAVTAPSGTARAGRDVLVIARAGTGAGSTSPAVTLRIGSRVLTLTYSISDSRYTLHATGTGILGSWPRVETTPMALLAFQISDTGIRVYTSPTTWADVTTVVIPRTDTVSEAGGTAIAGVSVRYTTAEESLRVLARVADRPVGIRRSFLEQERITATRGVENVTVRSVVDAWSQATLASVWMDEHGRPWCVARDRLVSTTSSRTVKVSERVFDGAWSIGDDGVRSRVVVKGQQGAVQSRPDFKVLVWQNPSTSDFDEVGVWERFIHADQDVEWGPIDTSLARAGSQWVGDEDSGSWVSAIVVLDGENTERWAQSNGVTYRASVQRLGQRTLKLTEWIDRLPSKSRVYTRTPTERTNVHPAWRGASMPIIRAEWVSTWADYTLTGATQGPAWAEPLYLDVGWWLTEADAQRVADALAVEVTTPMVTLDRVQVLWDPRRQIGDVETWTAVDAAGAVTWEARVLITGYHESWNGNVPSQSVDVRVITLTDPTVGKTYLDLATAYDNYRDMSTDSYANTHSALPGRAG